MSRTQKEEDDSPNEEQQVELEDEDKSIAYKVRELALKWSPAFEMAILGCIALISVLIRVFSVISNLALIN